MLYGSEAWSSREEEVTVLRRTDKQRVVLNSLKEIAMNLRMCCIWKKLDISFPVRWCECVLKRDSRDVLKRASDLEEEGDGDRR